MFVSVIIPCFRQAHFLPAAIESVLSQTHRNLEVIVINDGSDDNTEEVVKQYSSDHRVVYYHQKNQGLSAARNAGLRIASGDWIQLLDSDDVLHPDKLRVQLNAVEHHKQCVDVVYCDYRCFRDNDISHVYFATPTVFARNTPFESFALDWEYSLSIPPHAFLFKRELFKRLGAFEITLRNHEDWHWYLRCAASKARFIYIPEVYAYYRQTTVSMSRGLASAEPMRIGKFACLEKCMEISWLKSWHRSILRKRYLSDRKDEITEAIWKRRYSDAKKYFCVVTFSKPKCVKTIHIFTYVRLFLILLSYYFRQALLSIPRKLVNQMPFK